MSSLRRMLLIHFTIAVGVLAVGVSAAAAAAPTIERSTVQRQFDDFFVCDGFNIAGEFTVRRTAMSFYDAEGNLLRFVIHRNVEGTLTNLATGTTFPYREHDTITFYADGRVTITGDAAHVVIPGSGSILVIAGRFADDEVHGRFDEPIACEVLR